MNTVLINGTEQQQLDVRDRAFQYGDGVFETIAWRHGQLELWPQHMQRMRQSCKRLSLTMPDEDRWLEDIKKLNLDEHAVVKLILSRGVSGRGYAYEESDHATRITISYPWPEYPGKNQQGINCCFCTTPVSINTALAGIKHLNRLDNVLARNEWRDETIAEGFMLDHHQHIIEGTMSNVFCVLDNELYTPSLERSGVSGVMRQQVIQLAKEMQVPLNEIEISKQNFINVDSIFITNSLIGIWPVIKIIDGDAEVEFSTSNIVLDLQQALADSLARQ